jgi:hypothetical protein
MRFGLIVAFVALSFYVTEQLMRPGFYVLRTPEQGLAAEGVRPVA